MSAHGSADALGPASAISTARRWRLIGPLLAVGILAAPLLVAPSAAADTPASLQGSDQSIQSIAVAPNTTVNTQSVLASASLPGSQSWNFSLSSPSQTAVTNPQISMSSGLQTSALQAGGGCTGVTAQTASLPYTWTEAALSSTSNCPGPYQMYGQVSQPGTPLTVNPGFDSYRSVDTQSVAPGMNQTLTVGVTSRTSGYGQLALQWNSQGQTSLESFNATDTQAQAALPVCSNAPQGAACLGQSPTTFPSNFGQWSIVNPVVGDEYDIVAVLQNTSPSALTNALPAVTISTQLPGPSSSPPSATSATLADPSLDGGTPGSGSITFSSDLAANWNLNQSSQFTVQYQSSPSGGGGGGGGGQPGISANPNMGLADLASVSVFGSNLAHAQSYQLEECTAMGCDPSTSVPVNTNGSGNFGPQPFIVHATINVNSTPQTCTAVGCSIEALGPTTPVPTSGISFGGGGGGPSLMVNPNSAMMDNSTTSISGSGLTPAQGYQLEECSPSGCDPSTSVPVNTGPSGSFGPVQFTVHSSINVNSTAQSCLVTSCSIEAIGPSSPAPSAPITFITSPFQGSLYLSTYGHLFDGQPVLATSTPLNVGGVPTQFGIYECTATACDPSTLLSTTSDFLGHVSTLYDVHRYLNYTNPVTQAVDHVDCFSTQCFLQVEDTTAKAVTSPTNIWFDSLVGGVTVTSPLESAEMYGTVTLPGGKTLPLGTQVGIEACPVGTDCLANPAAGIAGIVSASSGYGLTGLTPGVAWAVEAYVLEPGGPGGRTILTSAPYQGTPTPGQIITADFVINGFTPLPGGDFVTGNVVGSDGKPLPSNPHGGSGYGPQSGVLACPGNLVFGQLGCTDMNVMMAPTDASGNYSLWLPAGDWNIAPFTTFAGVPGAPGIEGDYFPERVVNNIDPTLNLVIPVALTLAYTGPTAVTNGNTVTLAGKVVDQGGNPVGGQGLTLSLGTQSCVGWTTVATGIATCTIQVNQATGPVTATATLVQDAQYNPSPAVAGYVQSTQTITFAALGNKTYGNLPFTVHASSSSGLPVTFSVTAASASVCKSLGTKGAIIAIIGGGTCVVQADQTGNTTYAAAPSVQQTFTVAQASQWVLLLPIGGHTLVQSPVVPLAFATSFLLVTFATTTPSVCAATGTAGGSIVLIAAGKCTVVASQAGNNNFNPASASWSFTVSKASQTIRFAPLANRALTNSPFVVTATASSGLAVGFASTTPSVCTISGASVSLKTKGTCTIQANQPGNTTYNPAVNLTQSFRVT